MINILVAPTTAGSALTTVSLGLVRALDAQGLRVGFLKAIAPDYKDSERSVVLAREVLHLNTPDPMKLSEVQQQVSDGMLDRVLEDVVGKHAEVASDCDVMIIEGLLADSNEPS